jgi:hypothetical protein
MNINSSTKKGYLKLPNIQRDKPVFVVRSRLIAAPKIEYKPQPKADKTTRSVNSESIKENLIRTLKMYGYSSIYISNHFKNHPLWSQP